MVRLLRRGDLVDFDGPLHMWPDQRERFLTFMQQLVPEQAETVEVQELRKSGATGSRKQKEWTAHHFHALFGPESNPELEARLERTAMSVQAMRGSFPKLFYAWAHKRGYKQAPSPELIQSYLDEEDVEEGDEE